MFPTKQLVLDLKTGKSRPLFSQAPLGSSVTAPWRGVSLERHAPGAVEAFDWIPRQHVIALQLKGTAAVQWKNGSGAFRTVSWSPGRVSLFPAMARECFRTSNSGEVIWLAIEPKFLLCAASEMIHPDRFELAPQHVIEDPLLRAGILELSAEVDAGCPGGRFYGETVAATLAVHLVRHYSARPPLVREGGRQLTGQRLRRAIEFIQENLADDISLDTVAAAAGLSPFHFSRLFKKSTGLAPHQYLMVRRVERARELLLAGSTTIADVALQAGFCDQSHLAGHFKRIYGVTPRAFLRRTAPGGQLRLTA